MRTREIRADRPAWRPGACRASTPNVASTVMFHVKHRSGMRHDAGTPCVGELLTMLGPTPFAGARIGLGRAAPSVGSPTKRVSSGGTQCRPLLATGEPPLANSRWRNSPRSRLDDAMVTVVRCVHLPSRHVFPRPPQCQVMPGGQEALGAARTRDTRIGHCRRDVSRETRALRRIPRVLMDSSSINGAPSAAACLEESVLRVTRNARHA